jgi:hypothetical protein
MDSDVKLIRRFASVEAYLGEDYDRSGLLLGDSSLSSLYHCTKVLK